MQVSKVPCSFGGFDNLGKRIRGWGGVCKYVGSLLPGGLS